MPRATHLRRGRARLIAQRAAARAELRFSMGKIACRLIARGVALGFICH